MLPIAVREGMEGLRADDSQDPKFIAALGAVLEYADAMRTVMTRLVPGEFIKEGLKVVAVQMSIRGEDQRQFLTVKAHNRPGKKDPGRVVAFSSGRDMAEMLWKFYQKALHEQTKWREDVPYRPDDPNDAPESLPKWGD